MKKTKSIVISVICIIILLGVSAWLFISTIPAGNSDDSAFPAKPGATPSNDSVDHSERLKFIEEALNSNLLILVNDKNGLDESYRPQETLILQDMTLERETGEHMEKMLQAMKDAGLDTITIYSAFRNYSKQEQNFNRKVDQYIADGYSEDRAKELAAAIVNPPGKSEHQTGLAADISTSNVVNKYGSLHEEFENTPEYEWLYKHCAEYGFILRYPKDKVDVTGISFEPWHYRYVGTTYAKEIMSKKICLEEYLESLKKEKETLLAESSK